MPNALTADAIRIDDLPLEPLPADLGGLARLLCDAVESGASVSFMAGLTVAEARDIWARKLASRLARSAALVARDAGGIIGTVHLEPAWAPNQPHRAEVAKLLPRAPKDRSVSVAANERFVHGRAMLEPPQKSDGYPAWSVTLGFARPLA